MLLEFFNELKNNFMAVYQIRNVESIAMLERCEAECDTFFS